MENIDELLKMKMNEGARNTHNLIVTILNGRGVFASDEFSPTRNDYLFEARFLLARKRTPRDDDTGGIVAPGSPMSHPARQEWFVLARFAM